MIHAGFPPDWHRDPFNGQKAPEELHWSRIGDFDFGDIKILWEPSRFGFVYPLVRAYCRTGDERFARYFWDLVEDWREKNRPQAGVNWKCGQEIGIRAMAWLFGLYGFQGSESTTPERVTAMAQMIAVSAERIEKNISYALSQRNNHGISEASALFTIGLMFPELRGSERRREKGRTLLESLAKDLIYEDGSFVQHSVNYHRLMLHAYLWAARLGEINGIFFSSELKDRIRQACLFLYGVQDETSGRLPNYGQNDGALILPLDNCDCSDYRPVIQAAWYLTTGTRCYAEGCWDEDLLWLFGPKALKAPVSPPERLELKAESGGYYTLRSENVFAFVRCASFRDRPGQADMLHMDLWWKGQNIALDPGTYSYNAKPPWNNPFARTIYHNTVTVDGQDQMDRVGRFLWLPWVTGRLRRNDRSQQGHLCYWEGEHDGYRRLKAPVLHRRAILQVDDEGWLVLDSLQSPGEHRYRLHWLLADLPYEWSGTDGALKLRTPKGHYHLRASSTSGQGDYSLIRAGDCNPRGWRAAYYHHREPALSFEMVLDGKTVLFWTWLGPKPCEMTSGADGVLNLEADSWQAAIHPSSNENSMSIARAVVLSGSVEDRLDLS